MENNQENRRRLAYDEIAHMTEEELKNWVMGEIRGQCYEDDNVFHYYCERYRERHGLS